MTGSVGSRPNQGRPGGLPDVARVGLDAPFRWLAQGAGDFLRIPGQALVYGAGLSLVSAALAWGLYASGGSFWLMVLIGGFVFVAPMLAMGLYEAGRQLEAGQRPTLGQMLFVKAALRQDLAYLGLALALIYLFWGRMAQLVYGLSTYRVHRTLDQFIAFALNDAEGHGMLVSGTIVGGVIAFIAFALVVISAPMLLDRRTDVFVATVTSVRAVARNFLPMALWAALIALLTLVGVATFMAGLAVVFPWIGLASWRAYRELAPGDHAAAA